MITFQSLCGVSEEPNALISGGGPVRWNVWLGYSMFHVLE